MKTDIWSVLIVAFICQGMFVLVSLLLSKKRRTERGNLFLVLIILSLIWYLLEFLSIRNTWNIGLSSFYGTRYGSWFLLGPLTYFYFRSVTDSDWKFSKGDLVHFAPFVLFVLILPLLFEDVLNKRQVDYGMLSVFDHREKIIQPIQYGYSLVFIVQFVHLGYYLLKNLKLIKKYIAALQLEYAHINGKIKWLRTFNISLLIILLFIATFLLIFLKTDLYRRHMDYLYVLPMGFLLYLTGYFLMNMEWKPVDMRKKYAGSSLDKESITGYVQKLDHLIQVDHIYLNNQIRLGDLAHKMEISNHHLSQIINQYYKLSFFDFINTHRIQAAKKMIIDDPEKPLMNVAFDSGFNNKTSFVNAFKKFENTTPSKFREFVLTT